MYNRKNVCNTFSEMENVVFSETTTFCWTMYNNDSVLSVYGIINNTRYNKTSAYNIMVIYVNIINIIKDIKKKTGIIF